MPNKKIDAPTAENAKEYADLIVKIAKKNSNVDLDYSPSSLIDVDKIIEGFRQDDQSSDQIYHTLFSFGCYVGEVFKWFKAVSIVYATPHSPSISLPST